jgi:hypothetical protein
LLSKEDEKIEEKSAKKIQKIDNGIICQKKVLELGAEKWKEIADYGLKRHLLNNKDMSILATAVAIPAKVPSESQCVYLMNLLKKLENNGFSIN